MIMTTSHLYFTVIGLIIFVTIAARNCTEEQGFYECKSGKCIPDPWVCDGARDCPDGDDEIRVECGRNKNNCTGLNFECVDAFSGQKKCARPEWRCDGFIDCKNGFDEKNCEQNQSQLSRIIGEQTSNNRDDGVISVVSTVAVEVNNFKNDTICDEVLFTCKNGACIDWDKVCDNNTNCEDGSDEAEQQCNRLSTKSLIYPRAPRVTASPTTIFMTSLAKKKVTSTMRTIQNSTLVSILRLTKPMPSTSTKSFELSVKTDINSDKYKDKTPQVSIEPTRVYKKTAFEAEEEAAEDVKTKLQRYAIIDNANQAKNNPARNPVYGTPIVPVHNFQILFPLHANIKGYFKNISNLIDSTTQSGNDSF